VPVNVAEVVSKSLVHWQFRSRRFALYASGKTEAFMELYSQILDHGGAAFSAILRHVRDKPTEGCLFHCTGLSQ